MQGLDSAISANPILFYLLLFWSLPWKAYALWKAARAGSKVWFVLLLLLNTFGLVEILYIFIFSKPKWDLGKLIKIPKHSK